MEKTLEIELAELREEIAKEIESGVLSDDTSYHYKLALPVLRAAFAAIARGKVGE